MHGWSCLAIQSTVKCTKRMLLIRVWHLFHEQFLKKRNAEHVKINSCTHYVTFVEP